MTRFQRMTPAAACGICMSLASAGATWTVPPNGITTTWSYEASTAQFGTFVSGGGAINDQSFFDTYDEFEGLPGDMNSGAVEPLVEIGHAASFGNTGVGDLRGLAEVQAFNPRSMTGDTLNASASVSGSFAFTILTDVEFGYVLATDRTMSADQQTANSFASLRLDRVDGGVFNIFDLSTDERVFGSTMLSAGDYLITAEAVVEISQTLSSVGGVYTAQHGYNAYFEIVPAPPSAIPLGLSMLVLRRRRRR